MFFILGPENRWQRDLLRLLTKKEITLKYKRAYLGIIWSLLNPMLTGLIYFFAFSIVMRFKMPNYPLYLLSGLFPWFWFTSSISTSTNVFVTNSKLISKVIFPKHFLLLSQIAGQFVALVCSFPIIIMLVYYYDRSIGLNWFIGIPILVIIQFFIIYGMTMIVSSMNVYFRDIQHLIGVLLQMLFWLTGIIFPIEKAPAEYLPYLSLNPMLHLIKGWRDIIIDNTIDWNNILLSALVALIVYGIGVLVYTRLEKRFDEVL